MKTIAVDCRKINDGGIGTYLRNLLENWKDIDPVYSFALFCLPGQKDAIPSGHDSIIEHDYSRYSIGELYSFTKSLKKIGADLFYTPHYTLPFNLPCPSVVTIHDLIHLRRPVKMGFVGKSYAKFMINHAGRKSHTVLTDSEHSKNDMRAFFSGWSSKVEVVYPAVDKSIFRVYSSEQVSEFRSANRLTDDFVLYTGSLRPHKNPQALIMIAQRLNFPLVIASQDKEIFRRQFSGEKYSMRLISDLTERNLALLYNAARLFVFPSFYEGFGLPPLEAMACGLPVVCSNAASLPEVVGDAALTYAASDIDMMLKLVEKCWNDERTRDKLRKEGLRRAGNFDWKDSAERIFSIFKKAMVE